MGQHAARAEGTPDWVKTLEKADMLAFGPVGFAATIPAAVTAFETGAALGPAGREHAERLVAHGSPVATGYGAALLALLDGHTAWAALVDDPRELTVATGCVLDSTTLGGYAKSRLAASG